MLAIPVFRARVAPVLDWCSKIMIFPKEGADASSGREIDVMKGHLFRLMQALREQGIDTLICGALSPEILNYGESIGLRIIHGIAGDIEEVLRAHIERKLDQPRYWLPGCRGQRRYRAGAKCFDQATGVSNGPGPGRENASRSQSSGRPSRIKSEGGPGGFCICPNCGERKQHERGIPCSQVPCPACQNPMTRG